MSPLQSTLIGVSSSLPNLKFSYKGHGLVVEGISKFHLTNLLLTPHSHLIHSLNVLNTSFKCFLWSQWQSTVLMFVFCLVICFLLPHWSFLIPLCLSCRCCSTLWICIWFLFLIYALPRYLFLYCGFYFHSYSFVSSLDLLPEH